MEVTKNPMITLTERQRSSLERSENGCAPTTPYHPLQLTLEPLAFPTFDVSSKPKAPLFSLLGQVFSGLFERNV